MVSWDGFHVDRVWPGPPTLRMHVWGTSFSVLRTWDFERNRAQGWYVNLELPWRRTAIGFDSRDLILDITISDDLSSWAWKDLDELEWSLGIGKVSESEAESIRAAGLAAVTCLEGRAWPFVDDWSEWRPEEKWPLPTLPTGWNDPSL